MNQLSLFEQLEGSQTPNLNSLTKIYYSITEVAAMFEVNASMLRFWEKEFPIFLGNIKKNKKGDRYYNIENINHLKVIFHLVKEKKMTLEGAREYLKDSRNKVKDDMSMLATLNEIKSFLISLKNSLDKELEKK